MNSMQMKELDEKEVRGKKLIKQKDWNKEAAQSLGGCLSGFERKVGWGSDGIQTS